MREPVDIPIVTIFRNVAEPGYYKASWRNTAMPETDLAAARERPWHKNPSPKRIAIYLRIRIWIPCWAMAQNHLILGQPVGIRISANPKQTKADAEDQKSPQSGS
jgi:hypothetical protein